MPYWLRKKIMFYTYKAVIEKTPLFDVDDSVDAHVFVTELCSRLRPVSYPSGQIIYQRGEIARHMFILTAGNVEVLDKTHAFALTTLAPGAYFGEGCVLGDVRRRENVRAMGHVDVCQLVSHELDDLLDTYPHLHRALRSAYFKRKALLARFEAARAANAKLSLRRFVQTEMRGGKREGGGPPSDGSTDEDAPARGSRQFREVGLEDDETAGAEAPARTDADGGFSAEALDDALETGGSRDPTLEFDLTAEDTKEEEEAASLLSRSGSMKVSTRALELKVDAMEGKLEQTVAALRRVETLLRQNAKT
jgi:hyperpolarization activated cyclic nucleotide-gated potassium channel 2